MSTLFLRLAAGKECLNCRPVSSFYPSISRPNFLLLHLTGQNSVAMPFPILILVLMTPAYRKISAYPKYGALPMPEDGIVLFVNHYS